MNSTITARVDRHLAALPERVFDAWLSPESVRSWMAAALRSQGLSGDIRRVEIEPRVGGAFTFSDLRDRGEAVHWGTYQVVDWPHKLVFTWFTSKEAEQENMSTVTLLFKPEGTGCRVTLTHEMPPKWADYVDRTEKGWTTMLSEIEARCRERA